MTFLTHFNFVAAGCQSTIACFTWNFLTIIFFLKSTLGVNFVTRLFQIKKLHTKLPRTTKWLFWCIAVFVLQCMRLWWLSIVVRWHNKTRRQYMHLVAMVLNFRLYSKAVVSAKLVTFYKRKLVTTEWLMILSVESYNSVFARLRIAAK